MIFIFAISGCVHSYQPPRPGEPQALVKIRRVYELRAGDSLGESVSVGEYVAVSKSSDSSAAKVPRTDAIAVRPELTTITIATAFTHTVTWTETETYQETIPGTKTESYDCGTPDAPNTCTRTVDDSHTETRTRTVDKSAEVSDGACKGNVTFVPEASGVYLLDYTYRSDHACSVACYRQVTVAPGEFRNVPCVPSKQLAAK
ncbi:MAG: hypothetical protein ACXWP4_12190 [Polyangiales bacterium]